MSTRGWYEYYVVDPAKRSTTLAIQFYKWGDATPENALCEYQFLRAQLAEANDQLPISWVDDLLREQLGDLYPLLPKNFATGAFMFLLQRAAEEMNREEYLFGQQPEERPDYYLQLALYNAMEEKPFVIPPQRNPYFERIRRFLAVAQYYRPWREYGLRMNVLRWLQYITQVTREVDMGCIAGDFTRAWDISHIYRLFFWQESGRSPAHMEHIGIELCNRNGEDLRSYAIDTESGESGRRDARELEQALQETSVTAESLEAIQQQYTVQATRFWKFKEQPDPEEVRDRLRQRAELQGEMNILLVQVRKRFGAGVAKKSEAIMKRIENSDSMLALCYPVLDCQNADEWLTALQKIADR